MSAPLIRLSGIRHSRLHPQRLQIDEFEIHPGQTWGILGSNGSGKSSFAATLSGELATPQNSRLSPLKRVLRVSFEQEQDLLEREIREDEGELLQKIDYGRTTRELISELAAPEADLEGIAETLQLQPFIDRGFRQLSTGERRRLMIARALAQSPEMLVLDEPFDGLDIEFSAHLRHLLEELSRQLPLVLIVNRLTELGDYVTHLACLHEMRLITAGPRGDVEKSELWQQLQSLAQTQRPLPDTPSDHQPYLPPPGEPLIELRDIHVAYHQSIVLDQLNWTILPGQHWKVSGPNGCGKSTLVNLISGDHPQCYSNQLTLFGVERGQGESIWEVKRHMGLMSTTLHQDYRIPVTAETVLLSGFFDSIGVYRPVSVRHKKIANQWLDFLGLAHHRHTLFQRLSFGQQRLLLIGRSLIKRPHLLILDEPCQGLDPINRALVLELIDQVAKLGIAQVIYISHEPDDHLACLTHELRFIETPEGVDKRGNDKPESAPYHTEITALN